MDLDEEHPHFRHYQYFLASFDLLNYVHQPTRYCQTKRSCLDLLLIDEASLVHSCTPVPSTMETDHELVIADLLIAQPPSPPPVQPPYRNIKNITVSLFCNDLENQNLATFSNGKKCRFDVARMDREIYSRSLRHACTSKITARLPPKGTATYSLWLPLDDPGAETFNSSKTQGSPTADQRPLQFFIVLRRNATKLTRALKNRHFMDMCNEHSKSPRKLWSLLNSLTGLVKSHPPPQATLNSLSETFAAIVSDPSRPVHLVQTAETETRCTSEPSQERRRLCQLSPDGSKSFTKHRLPQSHWSWWYSWPFAKEMCPERGTIPYSKISIASFAARELPQTFKQADITPVYKSGDRETLPSNYRPISLLPIVSKLLEKIVSTQLKAFLASNRLSEIRFTNCANHSNWRCPCIYCESLTAGEILWKGNWLSLCRPAWARRLIE